MFHSNIDSRCQSNYSVKRNTANEPQNITMTVAESALCEVHMQVGKLETAVNVPGVSEPTSLQRMQHVSSQVLYSWLLGHLVSPVTNLDRIATVSPLCDYRGSVLRRSRENGSRYWLIVSGFVYKPITYADTAIPNRKPSLKKKDNSIFNCICKRPTITYFF